MCLVPVPFAGQFPGLGAAPSAVQAMAMLIDSFTEEHKSEFSNVTITTITKKPACETCQSDIQITSNNLKYYNMNCLNNLVPNISPTHCMT